MILTFNEGPAIGRVRSRSTSFDEFLTVYVLLVDGWRETCCTMQRNVPESVLALGLLELPRTSERKCP